MHENTYKQINSRALKKAYRAKSCILLTFHSGSHFATTVQNAAKGAIQQNQCFFSFLLGNVCTTPQSH